MLEGCGALFYCRRTDRFLFLLRDHAKYSNTWDLPGGKIDQGESVGVALEREVSEEIGIFLYDKKIIPIEKFTSDNKTFCYYTFMVIIDYEFVPDLNHEHKGYCWVPIESAPIPLHPGVYNTFNISVIMDKIKLVQQQYSDQVKNSCIAPTPCVVNRQPALLPPSVECAPANHTSPVAFE